MLVIDDGRNGWTAAAETAAARSAGAAVVVFARTTAATRAPVLAAVLPAALDRDLRVTDRRWALVGGVSDAGLADQAVAGAAGRYPALALIKHAATKKPAAKKPAIRKPAIKKPAIKKPAIKKPAIKKPAIKKPAVKNGKLPAGIAVTTVGALPAALTWAGRQTPPPLAASTPAATSLPVYHHHPHHSPSPAPGSSLAPPVAHRGGRHVAG